MNGSHDPAHFERLYQSNPDPWAYLTSDYEAEKYRHALAVLDDGRFANGLEVGCSIGVLTALLAERCDALLGVDVVEQALDAARARNTGAAWVRFQRMQVPGDWPDGQFDLIVLSEVLYFFVPTDIDRIADRVVRSLRPAGTVLLVNWLGRGDDPISGDDAAARFLHAAMGKLAVTHQDRRPGYRVDRLRAPG
ncbi:MAG: class I SAM-dependent DNA methyltransferase [Rhodopila sp.]